MGNKPTDKPSKKATETVKNPLTELYREDAKLSMTGRDFSIILSQIFDIRASTLGNVYGLDGQHIGTNVPASAEPTNGLYMFVMNLHQQYIDSGQSVGADILQAEIEAKKETVA